MREFRFERPGTVVDAVRQWGPGTAFLAGILRKEGIPSRVLTSPRGRASLYARLSSPRSGGRAVINARRAKGRKRLAV